MPFIGIPPFGQTVRTVTTITATASQTTFTPTGGYTVGYCDVYYNGIKLVGGTDFTATDGLTVVLTTGATSGAVVEIITYGSVTITDAVRRSGDTFAGAVAINSTLAAGNTTITGNTTTTTLNSGNTAITGTLAAGNTAITGSLTASANVNLDSGTFFVDGTNNRVGINNTAPTSALTVTGNAAFSSTVAVAGVTTLSANVILGTTTITANGGVGTAGQVLTSGATSNAYWSTIASPGPAFSAWLSTNQSVSSTVGTTLACNTEEYDTGNCYNNTGSTVTLNGLSVPAYSFCPNVAGYYTINAGYQLGGVSSFSRALLSCSKNGSNYKRLIDMGATSYVLAGTTVIYLNGTGDYVNFYGYISATGSLTFNGGSLDLTWINGAMIRSA